MPPDKIPSPTAVAVLMPDGIFWKGQWEGVFFEDLPSHHPGDCRFCWNVQGYGYRVCFMCQEEKSQCTMISLYSLCFFEGRRSPHSHCCKLCLPKLKKLMTDMRIDAMKPYFPQSVTQPLNKWFYENWGYLNCDMPTQ